MAVQKIYTDLWVAYLENAALEQQLDEKKCLFMIYTHGEINKFDQHTLTFSDSVKYLSKKFIAQLTEDSPNNFPDFFILSCHGGALLSELQNRTTHGDIMALSPEQDVVSGISVNTFVRYLLDSAQKGILFHTLQDLLTFYLVSLSSRTPPLKY